MTKRPEHPGNVKSDEPDVILTSDTPAIALHCHVADLPAASLRALSSQLSAAQRRVRIHEDAVGMDEVEEIQPPIVT